MQQFAKMEAHLRRVLVPNPAPLYLMRSYRRREPTKYDIFCCLGADRPSPEQGSAGARAHDRGVGRPLGA